MTKFQSTFFDEEMKGRLQLLLPMPTELKTVLQNRPHHRYLLGWVRRRNGPGRYRIPGRFHPWSLTRRLCPVKVIRESNKRRRRARADTYLHR